jgi:predicted RNA-binding protein with PUA-like domain
MTRWLLKTEPDSYAWHDLVRDRKTVWDGITNNLALKHLRTVRKGDEALIYHTGSERAVVGIARVVSDPYSDPGSDDERLVVVDLKPAKQLPRPVTLSEIRADPAYEGWDLLRNSRLSVVPVPEKIWKRLLKIAGGDHFPIRRCRS